MAPKPRFNFACERGWPGYKPVLRVMRTPFHELHTVQVFCQSRKRNVKYRNLTSRAAQVAPKRFTLELAPCKATIEFIRAWLQLHPRMNAASRRIYPGLERRPGSSGEETRQTHRIALEPFSQQRLQGRKNSVGCPLLNQVLVARIEA